MFRAMLKHLLVAIGSLLLAACAQAQPALVIQLDPAQTDLSLAGRMEWLEDSSTRMTLAEARTAQGWKVLSGMPNEGFTRSAYWLRLRLEQPADGTSWILDIDDTQLDEARLYLPLIEDDGQLQRAGRLVPRKEWALDSRIPTFRLRLPPGQHEAYLRLQSQHTLSFSLRLQSAERHLLRSTHEALLFGSYFGLLVVVMALQLFLWVEGRDTLSGWYLLYGLVILSGTLLRAGFPQFWLGEHQPGVNFLGVFTNLAPLALVRLTAVWLHLHRQMPRMNMLYQGGAYIMTLMTTGLVLGDNHAMGLQLGQMLAVLWFVVSFAIAGWLWRRRKALEAGHYLLVFGFMLLAIIIRMLRNLGVLPVNFLTDYALYIGTVMHLLLLCLYFIHRYKTLQSSLEVERHAREEQRDFVGMVSHEFRTPLAIINTSIQQLAANLDAPVEKTLQRSQNIRQATQRLTQLIDDYLSMDRLDSAHKPLTLRPCDPYDLIEEATSDWPLGRIRLQTDALPQAYVCDPDLLRIVLRNLLANADRHSPADSAIELEVRGRPGGGLYLRVQDHGEGIPKDELPRLFQKYFRGRASQGKPGAGLGLYLVQRIVTAHGGTIEVHSQPTRGTTFVIRLPADPA